MLVPASASPATSEALLVAARRRTAARRRDLAPGARVERRYAALAAEHRRILRRLVREHGDERGVLADHVPADLVVRVAVGVPGVVVVVPVRGIEEEARRVATGEGVAVRALVVGITGELQRRAAPYVFGHLRH